jgi:hypothetical protein
VISDEVGLIQKKKKGIGFKILTKKSATVNFIKSKRRRYNYYHYHSNRTKTNTYIEMTFESAASTTAKVIY